MPKCGFSNTLFRSQCSERAVRKAFDVLSDPEISAEASRSSPIGRTIPQGLTSIGEFMGGSDIFIEMYNAVNCAETFTSRALAFLSRPLPLR